MPFFQRYDLIITDPIIVTALPQVGKTMSVRINNPSAEPTSGRLQLIQGATKVDQPFSIAAGTTQANVTFQDVAPRPLQIGLFLDAPTGSDALRWWTYRFVPVALDPGSFVLRAEGDPKVPSSQRFEASRAPQDSPMPGEPCLSIHYQFDAGWKYLCLQPKEQQVQGKPQSLAIWIKGDDSGNIPRMRFVDSTGQTFQPDAEKLAYHDWRYIVFPLNGTAAGRWGGANDGVVHYPIRLDTLLLIDSAVRQATSGTVMVASPTLIYQGGD
jgi:hypothetical protein